MLTKKSKLLYAYNTINIFNKANFIKNLTILSLSLSLCVGVLFTLLCVVLAVWGENIIECQPVWVTIVVLLSIASFICIFIIWRQPESSEAVSFKVHMHSSVPFFLYFFLFDCTIQNDQVYFSRMHSFLSCCTSEIKLLHLI